jgi:sugar lactone lactonase YvrE
VEVNVELIVDAQNALGECMLWCDRTQSMLWTDILGRKLWRHRPSSGETRQWDMPERLGCFALTSAEGRLLLGLESRLAWFDFASGEVLTIVEVEADVAGTRVNDGRCDRQGRFWAGTMQMDMAAAHEVGRVYRYQADVNAGAALRPQFEHMIVPNGLAFSPDGKTLYLSDSHPLVQTIWAFDYDIDTGTPHGRRVFVDMKPLPGRPDGAAVDADGCYWICGNDAGLVHRFTPDGKLDRSLEVPVKKPAMCAFGGPQLDTLYVTSIRPGGNLSDQPLAGGVFALRPGIKGLPEPECRF